MRDTRNLSTFAEFFDADIAEPGGGGPFGTPPGIVRWFNERRTYLLKHPELSKATPRIVAVDRLSGDGRSATARPQPEQSVRVRARVSNDVPLETVLLHYAVGRGTAFQAIEMKPGDKLPGARSAETLYSAAIPSASAGAHVYYYVKRVRPPTQAPLCSARQRRNRRVAVPRCTADRGRRKAAVTLCVSIARLRFCRMSKEFSFNSIPT